MTDTLAGLRSAHGYLQRRIARELTLKRTPTLAFAYDDTTDRAMRVDALIETAIEGAQRNGAQIAPDLAGVEEAGREGEDA